MPSLAIGTKYVGVLGGSVAQFIYVCVYVCYTVRGIHDNQLCENILKNYLFGIQYPKY